MLLDEDETSDLNVNDKKAVGMQAVGRQAFGRQADIVGRPERLSLLLFWLADAVGLLAGGSPAIACLPTAALYRLVPNT